MNFKQAHALLRQTPRQSRAQRAWFCLCAVCLSVYMAYILYFAHSGFLLSPGQTAVSLAVFVLLSALLCFVLMRACALLGSAGLRGKPRDRMDLRVFAAAAVLAGGVFAVAFAACWPGGVSYDASNQWRQVHSGEFNNWHPLLHTLCIWLVTRVSDSYPFAVCVQIAAFTLAMAYLTATLHKRGVPAWLALAVHTLVAASLPVRNTLMYLGKDSAMTTLLLVAAAHTVNMLHTHGQWLRKPLNAAAFGLVLGVATLLRHNAMLFTFPMAACALLCFKASRRQAALAACVLAAVMALVQGPLFGALDVVYPSNLLEESVGIPMTVLGDVKQRAPEKLDEETTAFLAALADDEAWQNTYRAGMYNSIKFTYDREKIAFTPPDKLLRMTLSTVTAAPRIAFEAVNDVTDLVWDVTGKGEGYEHIKNSGDIPSAMYGRAGLNGLGQKLISVVDAVLVLPPLRWLTQNIGVQLLLLLLVTLWALYRHGVAALMPTLPILLYDLGTMVLLCGNDARFFQFSMTLCLPMVLALCYLPKENEA